MSIISKIACLGLVTAVGGGVGFGISNSISNPKIEKLNNTVIEQETEISDLRNSLNESTAMNILLESKLAENEAEIVSLNDQLEKAFNGQKKLQLDIAELTDIKKALELDISAKETTILELETTISNKENDITTLQSDIATLQTQLETSETNNEELQAQLTEKINLLTTTQSELEIAQTELANTKTQLATAQAELNTANNTITEKENTITELNTTITNLNSQISTLQSENANLKIHIEELQSEINFINGVPTSVSEFIITYDEGWGLYRITDYIGSNPNVVLPTTCSIDENGNAITGTTHKLYLADSVFSNNSTIKKVKFLEAFSATPFSVFERATNLEEVYISNTFTSFCSGSFSDCSNLKSIYYDGTQEEWNNIEIQVDALTNGITIYFNDGTSMVYGETAETIAFTIDGRSYQAEEGTTWEEWINSDSNTIGLTISEDNFVVDSNGASLIIGTTAQVGASSEITAGQYLLVAPVVETITFTVKYPYDWPGGDQLTFNAEKNMTWREWLESDYCPTEEGWGTYDFQGTGRICVCTPIGLLGTGDSSLDYPYGETFIPIDVDEVIDSNKFYYAYME